MNQWTVRKLQNIIYIEIELSADSNKMVWTFRTPITLTKDLSCLGELPSSADSNICMKFEDISPFMPEEYTSRVIMTAINTNSDHSRTSSHL
jgi:hypothetical protein